METGAAGEGQPCLRQALFLRRILVGGDAAVAGGDFPGAGRALAQSGRRASRLKSMGQVRCRAQRQPGVAGAVADEAGDGFRHHPSFPGAGALFYQQLQVEASGRQPFQRRLANLPEAGFVNVAQQQILQVVVAQSAGIVVAEYSFHLRCGQDFADHIEHGVIVQGVPDFLDLVQRPLDVVELLRPVAEPLADWLRGMPADRLELMELAAVAMGHLVSVPVMFRKMASCGWHLVDGRLARLPSVDAPLVPAVA